MSLFHAKIKGYLPVPNPETTVQRSSRPNVSLVIPWITTVLLLLLSAYLYSQHVLLSRKLQNVEEHGSFTTGWTTDFSMSLRTEE